MSNLLDSINTPADIRKLSVPELENLASEVRRMIIDTVSRNGGHLASNLGVVELTIALLRIFDPPSDSIVWDVSHQTYAYKILTGRKDLFPTLRQMGGLSGFIKREESEYDAFGAGHSGTAVSAALGIAVARDQRKGNEQVVAILGDGSAGCGMAYEAFNNVASATKRFVVILNDNEMSIDANVGAMSRYLGRQLASPRYNRWKRAAERVAEKLKMGWLRSTYYRIEEAIKGLFLKSFIFEEFGLRYIGPVDGHNIRAVMDALTIARESDRPIIVHVATQKGHGYAPAEKEPELWHSTSSFDIASGEASSGPKATGYSDVFGQVIERLATEDKSIVAITAAMTGGTGLSHFAERFPDRFFDVGISEEHAAVFAAGMASAGLRPFYAVYSTFFQRAIDCVIHDICLQRLPVVMCLDRAGIVSGDGPTHHGVFDIQLLCSIPGLTIMQPKDESELANMLFTVSRLDGPSVIRYPRGSGPGADVPKSFTTMQVGKAEVIRQTGDESPRVWIWALGDMIELAASAADILANDGVSAGVVNARFVKPLDDSLLAEQMEGTRLFATIENGIKAGGFGSAVEVCLMDKGFDGRVLRFGWPEEFVPHGSREELLIAYDLTSESIARRIAKQARSN